MRRVAIDRSRHVVVGPVLSEAKLRGDLMKRLLVSVTVTFLTACSGTAGTPDSPARPAAEVAGVVAKHQPDLENAEGKISVAGCQRTGSSLFECLAAAGRIGRLRGFVTETQDFIAEWTLGADPAEEVAGIYDATVTASSEVFRVGIEAEACWTANAGKTIDPCEPVMQELTDAATALVRELRAWQPYL